MKRVDDVTLAEIGVTLSSAKAQRGDASDAGAKPKVPWRTIRRCDALEAAPSPGSGMTARISDRGECAQKRQQRTNHRSVKSTIQSRTIRDAICPRSKEPLIPGWMQTSLVVAAEAGAPAGAEMRERPHGVKVSSGRQY